MREIGKIYEESDYDKFNRLKDNRDVLQFRLTKILASIKEKYIINPIIINEKWEIIDGQGRFEARKEMALPIHFIIAEGATSDDCRRMNKYNTKWTSLDFCKSYAKSHIKSYELLLETCKKLSLPINRVLRLSNKSGHGKGDKCFEMSLLERGELEFTEADSKTVERVANYSNDIHDALQFSIRPNDAFYTAVKVCCETDGYDHNRMLRNCRLCRSSYTQMSNLDSQLKEFERIYNYRSKTNRLYFSDYMRNRGTNVRDYTNNYSPYEDTDVSSLKRQ